MNKINCDMCGKVDDGLLRAIIESVELSVCSGCSKFGKILSPVNKNSIKLKPKKVVEKKREKIEILADNFSGLIKKKREQLGISQKDFAGKINEKESVIHHLETGTFEPQLSLAKKIEKFLGITLIEEYEEKHQENKKAKSESFTLGDFIKVKK